MKSVAFDLHGATFSWATGRLGGKVVPGGPEETSAEKLIDVVKGIGGRKTVVVEESHLAQWAKRVLEPHVERVIICDPLRNSWIARDDFADDRSSAVKLVRLHLGGFLKELGHPDEPGEQLRASFLHYYDMGQQVTRIKNKAKACFRQEAIPVAGGKVYEREARNEWLEKLDHVPHLRRRAKDLLGLLETLDEKKRNAYRAMVKLAKKRKAEFRVLQTIPGIRQVVATGYLAMIETPHRFSRKNKLWKYAGWGNQEHTSDDVVYGRRASRTGNRPLKWLVRVHFNAAVKRSSSNRFRAKYERWLASGLGKTAARRQTCRALLSVVRAVWMKGEAYRDNA